MADSLTVPFALATGFSAAVVNTDATVTAGLAEVIAGAIAMGLGGHLAARTNAEHYAAEEQREHHEIDHLREREIDEVAQIFREYRLEADALGSIVAAVAANRQRWVDFMMRFKLRFERPDPKRAPISAATIGGSYVVGGLTPTRALRSSSGRPYRSRSPQLASPCFASEATKAMSPTSRRSSRGCKLCSSGDWQPGPPTGSHTCSDGSLTCLRTVPPIFRPSQKFLMEFL